MKADLGAAVIRVEGLTKVYRLYDRQRDRVREALTPFGRPLHKPFLALNNVNIEVKRGECVGIIGLNGSGKSTLLQILAGVLTPTSGTVTVTGRIAALLELGSGFNPEFTGRENAEFQCSIMGYTRTQIERLLPDIIAFAEIGAYIDQPVKTYSSGMYVRLAFAVASSVEPDILIIDEALAVGDMRFQARCMSRIRSFRDSGKTLLFVSHDPGAVKSLCQRAYLLDRGSIVDEGAPDRVFNYYNGLIAEKDGAVALSTDDPERSRRYGTRAIAIAAVRLLDARKQNVEIVTCGEQVTLELMVDVNADVDNPTFGFLIRDRLGNDIFGVNNYLLESPSGILRAGTRHKVTYTFPADLGANVYTVTVACHKGDTHVVENFDWINEALVFRVTHGVGGKFSGCARLPAAFVIEGLHSQDHHYDQ